MFFGIHFRLRHSQSVKRKICPLFLFVFFCGAFANIDNCLSTKGFLPLPGSSQFKSCKQMGFTYVSTDAGLPKLLPETNIAPETLGLEDEFPFGARPPARCELLVLGSVSPVFPLKYSATITSLNFQAALQGAKAAETRIAEVKAWTKNCGKKWKKFPSRNVTIIGSFFLHFSELKVFLSSPLKLLPLNLAENHSSFGFRWRYIYIYKSIR